MRLTSTAFSIAAAVSTVAVAMPAGAHGIWFVSRAKQPALIFGLGADDLDTVKRLPLLERVEAFDANYQPIKATPRVSGPIVFIDTAAQPTLLAAYMPYGIWSRVGNEEWEKKTLLEMPNATASQHTVKYAVAIVGPLAKPIPPLPGQNLQIVPIEPIPTKLGTPLKYRVLYMGKPIAGVKMINDFVNDPDAKETETAADGTVTLPVRNQGLNVVRAVYVGPSDQPTKYRQIEYTATLAFTLAHLPE